METPVAGFFNLFRIWKGKESLEVFTLQQNKYGFMGGGIVRGQGLSIRYKIHQCLCIR